MLALRDNHRMEAECGLKTGFGSLCNERPATKREPIATFERKASTVFLLFICENRQLRTECPLLSSYVSSGNKLRYESTDLK